MRAAPWLTLVLFELLLQGSEIGADDAIVREVAHIRVHDCRTEFVERSVLSVERLGAIEFVAEEGATVAAGDLLIQLQDDVAEAALDLAEHQAQGDVAVEVALKAAEAARFEFEVAERSNAEAPEGRTPPVPYAELTRLRLAAEQAALEVAAAEHELETYRLAREQALAELNTYRVLAPGSGVITRAYHRAGETVQQGEPILELVRTETIRVEGRISLADARHVSAGQTVLVFIADDRGEQESLAPVEGVLGFVDVSVIPSLQEVRIWADIPNSDHWKAGVPCEMEITLPVAPAPDSDTE